jgi:hypothetical protein
MSSVSPPRHAKRPGTQRGAFPSVARSSASARARSRAESRFVRPRPRVPPVVTVSDPKRQPLAPGHPQLPVGALPLVAREAQKRSSDFRKSSFPVVPSMCFLPCVSFVGCRQDTRGVTSGHQGGVSTTGGGCQPDVGWGVRTTPGPGQRNQSRTPGQFPVLGRTGSQSRAGKRGRPTRVRRASMVHANRPTDGVYAT